MDIEKTHLKALLDNPQTRQEILNRLDDEELISADIDNISASDFAALHDAAWEVFLGGAPVVKSYLFKAPDGEEYPIEIVGVKGAYAVCVLESDNAGMFESLEEAEGYIGCNWLGDAWEDTR